MLNIGNRSLIFSAAAVGVAAGAAWYFLRQRLNKRHAARGPVLRSGGAMSEFEAAAEHARTLKKISTQSVRHAVPCVILSCCSMLALQC